MARVRKPPFGIQRAAHSGTESNAGGISQQPAIAADTNDRTTATNQQRVDGAVSEPIYSDDRNLGIDPANLNRSSGGGDGGSGGGDGSGERKRRKYTRRVKFDSGEKEQAKSSLAKYIALAHATAAKIFKIDELVLTEKEAQDLADAAMTVAGYYKIPMIAGEVMAWFNLLAVSGAIYAPRFAAHAIKAKQKTTDAKAPHKVTPITITEANAGG